MLCIEHNTMGERDVGKRWRGEREWGKKGVEVKIWKEEETEETEGERN